MSSFEQLEDWHLDGTCAGDVGLWFATDRIVIEEAKRRCLTCPVLEECMKFAGEVKPYAGVWAGVEWHDGHPAGRRRKGDDESASIGSTRADRQVRP